MIFMTPLSLLLLNHCPITLSLLFSLVLSPQTSRHNAKTISNDAMKASGAMKRTVYRALLRQARLADTCDLTPHMARGPTMRHLATPDMQEILQDPTMDWTDVEGSVRRLARRDVSPAVGIEACRLLAKVCEIARAPIVKCAVGDVVRHRVWGHLGVVVEVHDQCNMDPQWVTNNIGSLDHPFLQEPWYGILLDTSHGGFVRHGALRNHERVNAEVHHPRLVTAGWVFNNQEGRYERPANPPTQ